MVETCSPIPVRIACGPSECDTSSSWPTSSGPGNEYGRCSKPSAPSRLCAVGSPISSSRSTWLPTQAPTTGLRIIRSSQLKPVISTVVGCPTLFNTFTGAQLSRVLALCRRYPRRHKHPTGFLNGGALIAFAHGMPNNSPPILHSRTKGWTPLFHGRSTAGAELSFPSETRETVADRATRLLRIGNANAYLSDTTGNRWITTMMVLAAVEAGARSASAASARSGLSLSRIEEILS